MKSTIAGTKPTLRTIAKIVLEVTSRDFEDYIEEVYGKRYDFIAGEDVSDDSTLTFNVINEGLDPSEVEDLKEFMKTGEGNLLANIFLIDLVERGLIQPAEYAIHAEW